MTKEKKKTKIYATPDDLQLTLKIIFPTRQTIQKLHEALESVRNLHFANDNTSILMESLHQIQSTEILPRNPASLTFTNKTLIKAENHTEARMDYSQGQITTEWVQDFV